MVRAGWLCSFLVWREPWWPTPIVLAFPVILPQAADRSGWETHRELGRKEKWERLPDPTVLTLERRQQGITTN